MKRLLFLILLLPCLVYGQTVGIKVASPIIKNNPSDNTVTGYADLLNGGYHIVPTISGRDSLNTAYSKTLKSGMLCYVTGVDSTYRWDGSTWIAQGAGNVTLSQLTDSLNKKANLLGGNTFQGLQKIGNENTTYGTAISISNNIDSLNRHSIDEYSILAPTSGGEGYGVIDVSTEMAGAVGNDHFNAYQSRLNYSSNSNMLTGYQRGMNGFLVRNSITGTGTTVARGIRIDDIQGSGNATDLYGIYMEAQTKGTTSNWAIWSGGGKSYFGGNFGIGTENPSSLAGYRTLSLNSATDGGLLEIKRNDVSKYIQYPSVDDIVFQNRTLNGKLLFATNDGFESMSITQAQTDINNNTSIDGNLDVTSGNFAAAFGQYNHKIRVYSDSTLQAPTLTSSPGKDMILEAGGSKNLILKPSGNVGLNELNPTSKFEIANTNGSQFKVDSAGTGNNFLDGNSTTIRTNGGLAKIATFNSTGHTLIGNRIDDNINQFQVEGNSNISGNYLINGFKISANDLDTANVRTVANSFTKAEAQPRLGFMPYNPASYPVNMGGETLQSITDRGNSTTNSITSTSNGFAASFGEAGNQVRVYSDAASQAPTITSSSGKDLRIEAGGIQSFVAKTSGNILIGTTTDDGVNKLQVNGNIKATSIIKSGGTSSQFLKADGSVDASTYLTSSTGVSSITGTTNQVVASASTGAVTLSLPQSIATSSTPQFARLGLGVASSSSTFFNTSAGTTTQSSFRVPNGVAPTTPVSGDWWSLTTGLRTQTYDGTQTKDVIFDKVNNVFAGYGVGAIVTDNSGNLSVAPSADRTLSNKLSKTANYTVTLSDFGANGELVLEVDATAGAVTITLPSLANMTGVKLMVWKTDSSGNAVTISGAVNINGSSTASLATQWASLSITGGTSVYLSK